MRRSLHSHHNAEDAPEGKTTWQRYADRLHPCNNPQHLPPEFPGFCNTPDPHNHILWKTDKSILPVLHLLMSAHSWELCYR